jgi:Ca-activated chloride channel family protein
VRRNNRVVLLTDGIANRGVVDPETIASDARQYNDKGVYLSTIGLGQDFNDALLSKLATQGKGAYHFVDSAEEMDKVFRQDVSGLVQKAASDVAILFRPAPDVRLAALTGYEGMPPAGPIEVRQKDMGTGDSQVLLARLNVGPGQSGQRSLGTVELRYTDLFSQRPETLSLPVYTDASRSSSYDPLWDVEVLRNVTIQRTAEALKEIDRLYKMQRYQEAHGLASRSEQELRRVAALTGEAQMLKDADLMRKYQTTLSTWIESQRATPPPEEVVPNEPTRIYRGRATPTVPVVEVK